MKGIVSTKDWITAGNGESYMIFYADNWQFVSGENGSWRLAAVRGEEEILAMIPDNVVRGFLACDRAPTVRTNVCDLTAPRFRCVACPPPCAAPDAASRSRGLRSTPHDRRRASSHLSVGRGASVARAPTPQPAYPRRPSRVPELVSARGFDRACPGPQEPCSERSRPCPGLQPARGSRRKRWQEAGGRAGAQPGLERTHPRRFRRVPPGAPGHASGSPHQHVRPPRPARSGRTVE